MANDVTTDVLMFIIVSGSEAIEAEANSLTLTQSDSLLRDFKNGKFFEVSDFAFTIKLKDNETALKKPAVEDRGIKNDMPLSQPSYARWRTMDPDKPKPDPVYNADIDDFSITRAMDAASPILLDCCAKQKCLPKAVLVKRSRTPAGVVLGYLRMEFTDVRIRSVSFSDGETVRETCKFRYERMEVSYVRRKMDNSVASSWPCKWVTAKPDAKKTA